MGKQETKTYRGKCFSETKKRKDGQPKRAGNWSAQSYFYSSLQVKDYRVFERNGVLIVGDHTPLTTLLPAEVVWLAQNDPNFAEYKQDGTQPHDGKNYQARRILTRFKSVGTELYCGWRYLLRLEIFNEHEFVYEFPEY